MAYLATAKTDVDLVLEHFDEVHASAGGSPNFDGSDRRNADLLLHRFGGDVDRATAWIDLVFESPLRRSAGLTLSKLVCWSLTPLDQIDRIVRAWQREKAGKA